MRATAPFGALDTEFIAANGSDGCIVPADCGEGWPPGTTGMKDLELGPKGVPYPIGIEAAAASCAWACAFAWLSIIE